jgi:hypothetical protein
MVKTTETPYAEAKSNKLYLPPIDEVTGAVIRDYYDGVLHFPAGYTGTQRVKWVEQEDDFWKPWSATPKELVWRPRRAKARELTPPPSVTSGEPRERDRGVSYYSNSKPNSLIGNSSEKEISLRNETKGLS